MDLSTKKGERMIQRYYNWTQTFKGALTLALLSLLCLAWGVAAKSMTLVVLNAVCIVYWVFKANKASIKGHALGMQAGTQGEIDLLKDCHREMGRIIVRKELALLAKEKDDGTGHTPEPKDNEADVEGPE
jgi:hypothetical protein